MKINPHSAKCLRTLNSYAVYARFIETMTEDYIGSVSKADYKAYGFNGWIAHHRDHEEPVGWFRTRAEAVDYLVRITNEPAVPA